MDKSPDQTEVLSCVGCGATGSGCACNEPLAPFDPWLGKQINAQYEILSLIARGGMGAVYRARHLLLSTNRAIKVIRSDLHRDDVVYQRFRQEAQAVMGLSHPNIVSFHEFGIVDSTPFVVMDLIEGVGLDAVIKSEGQLETTRALDIFVQVAGALEHAHSKGIFHRDIKPSNIMLVDDGQGHEIAKVLDFGIAKITSNEGQKLTSTGEIFGSPVYMSPEQGRGQTVDARSDIYSLGCVIYETLCGKPPFQGVNAIETIMKHLNEQPAKMFSAKKKKDFDPVLHDLEAIVSRCLEKEPEKRYASMAALEGDLKRLSYGERLLNLQREMSQRRSTDLLVRYYKYVLITFAVLVPVYAVYSVYVDPKSWRHKLGTSISYQDTAEKNIAQIIPGLPKDHEYEVNLAYLLWNEAQIIRLKSSGNSALLPRAISIYEQALAHLDKFVAKEGPERRIKRELRSDCYDSLARAYLQKFSSDPKAAAIARLMAEKAVSFRRESLDVRGKSKETEEDLAGSLLLLAQARMTLEEEPEKTDQLLKEAEKLIKHYDPVSWLMSECLLKQGENAIKRGAKDDALKKLQAALKIEWSLNGANSPEAISLRARISAINTQSNTQQSNHDVR